MYGEDSCGRKVSLLNDSPSSNTFSRPKVPTLSTRSRPSTSSLSSCTSREGYNSSRSSFSGSPPRHSHSPPTPPLVRLDSQSSLSQTTPSPMTPQYGFEPMDQHMKRDQNQTPYYNNYNNRANGYPQLQETPQQPYYNLTSQQQQLPRMSDFGMDDDGFHSHGQRTTLQPLQTQLSMPYSSDAMSQISAETYQTPTSATTTKSLPPKSAPSTSAAIKTDPTTPITTSNKTPTAKKKYPCPHATRFNCTDTFTTSGHAARHGKKHTGEKNIMCPTCNKAFTRKDNMKQHERTHKGGSRASSTAASPVIGTKSASRKSSMSNSEAMDVDEGQIEGSRSGRAQRPKMKSELSEIMEGIDRETNGRISSEGDEDGEGESPGLDALATAAIEMR